MSRPDEPKGIHSCSFCKDQHWKVRRNHGCLVERYRREAKDFSLNYGHGAILKKYWQELVQYEREMDGWTTYFKEKDRVYAKYGTIRPYKRHAKREDIN